jgi:deazaflavin-dependent oxidoreductase (nitroreductase family)
MSFDTPNGTRGARELSGRFMRWMNTSAAKRVARKGTLPGMRLDALVLVTVGGRSGLERTSPLAWFPGPGGSWLIVAAAAGAARNPGWYHNLKANPDRVKIEISGRTVPVTAEQLHGSERERAWQQIVTAAAQFGKYQEKTDREMPVIRLVRKVGEGTAAPE